jgi:hypothetical protein
MYIYGSAQAESLDIYFVYHYNVPAGFLPNSRDRTRLTPYTCAFLLESGDSGM